MARVTDDEQLTVPETSRLLKTSVRWVYQAARAGLMSSVKLGGHIRVPKRELLDLIGRRAR